MNWLDIFFALVIAGSMIQGFRQGFTREFIGFIAGILGLACGIWFYGVAGAFLLPYVSSPAIANMIGFLLVFAGIVVLGSLVAAILARVLKWAGLSLLDRFLGGLLGLVRAALVCIAVLLILLAFSPGSGGAPRSVVDSRIAPYVMGAARMISMVAPRELKDGFERRYNQVQDIWKKALSGNIVPAPSTTN